jgi:hypothetical protein
MVLGARVLAEFRDDTSRYADPKSRKNHAGTSPVTRASGKHRVFARHGRNRRLNDACNPWAVATLGRPTGRRRRTGAALRRRDGSAPRGRRHRCGSGRRGGRRPLRTSRCRSGAADVRPRRRNPRSAADSGRLPGASWLAPPTGFEPVTPPWGASVPALRHAHRIRPGQAGGRAASRPTAFMETAPICGTFYGMPEAPAATWTSRPGKARLPHPSVLCPTRLPGGSVGCHQPVACTEGAERTSLSPVPMAQITDSVWPDLVGCPA